MAETAGLRPMAATVAAYVQDVRVAAADAFADLREKVDGELSAARDVLPHLATAAACRAWLEKLVTKPAPLARRARQVSTSGSGVAVAEAGSGAVEPFVVLTWNINGVQRPKSAQAPADERSWSAVDNLDAVQAEVLRWRPDVFSLQECAGEVGLHRFGAGYAFVGARSGHEPKAGFVHLYAKAALSARRVDCVGVLGVAAVARVRGVDVAFVAVHLANVREAEAKRLKHLGRASDVALQCSADVVLFGDMNLPDAELAKVLREPLRARCLNDAGYSQFSWDPRRNRYSDEEGYATGPPARFDRVLYTGNVFGCSYLVAGGSSSSRVVASTCRIISPCWLCSTSTLSMAAPIATCSSRGSAAPRWRAFATKPRSRSIRATWKLSAPAPGRLA